jgi:hypothetical protein
MHAISHRIGAGNTNTRVRRVMPRSIRAAASSAVSNHGILNRLEAVMGVSTNPGHTVIT